MPGVQTFVHSKIAHSQRWPGTTKYATREQKVQSPLAHP